jgi:hypothetical protein
VGLDVAGDLAGEIGSGSENAVGNLALKFREPDFELIEPGKRKSGCDGVEG